MTPNQDPLAGLGRDLTSNGLRFLRRSVHQLAAEQTTLESLSFAIVDLATSVEILLKARLVQEHWTLIASNPDKITVPSMVAGDTKTVTPDQAVNRLQSVVGLDLKKNGRVDQLNTLAKLRNRAIHFSMEPTPVPVLRASLGQSLDFVLWLLDREFKALGDQSVVDEVELRIDELTTLVGTITDLVQARMDAIGPELERSDVCVGCPRCQQPALTLTEGQTSRCMFCLWTPIDGVDCAEEYASTLGLSSRYEAVTDGDEWPVYACPACSEFSLVAGIRVAGPDHGKQNLGRGQHEVEMPAHWGCFGCGLTATQFEIDLCTRCGDPATTSDGSVPICETCYGDLVAD